MAKQLLKYKGPDGKWQTVASHEIGQYGPRIGVNAPVLRRLLESDGWINFSVFQDDRQERASPATKPAVQHSDPLDDEILF
ncbi:MAG: hypothetical protein K8U57_37045 [Planctomycetes bacterium]|nr:hypothetical protein [Planctomycetota bacterium]